MSHSKNKHSFVLPKQVWGYCFLGMMVIQTILLLLKQYGMGIGGTENIYLAIGLGISGGVFVYLNQSRLQKMERDAWRIQQKRKHVNNKKFSKKYPLLSKIPVIGFLVQKWQSEPLKYQFLLTILCILGAAIYLYDLAYYDWLPDEPLVVGAAKGYLETGTYTRWDFWMNQAGVEEYDRAWPHSWMVAQSIKVFGLSEWTTRLVSVFWGILFIPLLYGVSFFFLQNRFAALVVTFVCVMHPYFIIYFRRVRMYAVLTPTFVLLFYLSYQVLTTHKQYSWRIYQNKWMRKYLNYDWALVVGTLLLLYFSLQIHVLSFVLLPLLLPLIVYLIVFKGQSRLLLPSIVGAIGIFSLNYDFLAKNIQKYFSFFEAYSPSYIADLLTFPFPTYTTVSILLVGLLFLWFGKNQTRMFALYFLLGAAFCLYVYMLNFHAHFRYILHLVPLVYLLIIGVLLKMNRLFPSKWQRAMIPSMVVLLSMGNFVNQSDWIYSKFPEAQFSSKAYTSIQNNIQADKQGLIALYFEDMYMQGMGKKVQKINIPNNRQYKLQELQKDLEQFEGGAWITWATHKTYHIRPKVQNYIARNCRKYHGYGVDKTLVEVYYCE